jgi:trehalose 6-phosphate synthase/phosphatase
LVSGRPQGFLEAWFGKLNMGLHAEHGHWSRAARGNAWVGAGALHQSWRPQISQMLTGIACEVPGSFVEEKTASVAWHYRRAAPEAARFGLQLALSRLAVAASAYPIELLNGAMVLEVRAKGINKGLVVHEVLAGANVAGVLSVGDDTTDQDLFSASPPHALTVAVGDRPLEALHRVPSYREVRSILRVLLHGE